MLEFNTKRDWESAETNYTVYIMFQFNMKFPHPKKALHKHIPRKHYFLNVMVYMYPHSTVVINEFSEQGYYRLLSYESLTMIKFMQEVHITIVTLTC